MKPAAVVLAAGAGSRFGGGKVTALLGGRPLLAHLLDSLSGMGLEVVGVTRDGDEGARSLFADYGFQVTSIPPGPQSASLRAGVSAAGDVPAFLILLGDQPMVGRPEIEAVLAAWEGGAKAALVDGGEGPQPPAVFDRSLRDRLLALEGDRGAKSVALGLGDGLTILSLPPGPWMTDIDTEEELSRLERTLSGGGGDT